MMTSEKNFVIYRSSAGSGKTYTLAKEYLTQALREDYQFKHILAVTFTNKATQEMKDRIIRFLHDISEGKALDLAEPIAASLGESLDVIQTRARRVLYNILHNYAHFSVMTIDSFFQNVIRSFTKELGLQGGVRLELDLDKVKAEMVDKVIADVGINKRLTKWLTQFSEQRLQENKGWDLQKSLSDFAYQIFSEDFKAIEKDIAEFAEQSDQLKDFIAELSKVRKGFEQKMNEMGHQAIQILDDLGLAPTDFKFGKSSFVNYFFKVKALGKGNGKADFEPGARVLGAIDHLEAWTTKTTPPAKKELIERAYAEGLNDLLVQIVAHQEQFKQDYYTTTNILRYMYSFGILTNLIEKLQAYRQEHDVMLISDASHFLNQIIEENDTPFIYEKIGMKFQNFLIDEFQDTSGFQWNNFLPLIQNSLGEGHKNLVVGDVKQSIYRWRGGDLELLQNQIVQDIDRYQPDTTDIQNLGKNWRAKQQVIAFNNAIFNEAPTLIAAYLTLTQEQTAPQELQQKLLRLNAKLVDAYSDVLQEVAPKNLSPEVYTGFAKAEFIEKDKGSEQSINDLTLEKLPRIVENLQDHGYHLKDIAFLVRNGKEGALIADYFLNYKHEVGTDTYRYDVVSSESLYLKNATVVRVLIAALQYLNDSRNKIAYQTLRNEYLNYLQAHEQVLEYDQLNEIPLPSAFIAQQKSLYRKPLYELVETLIQLFGLNEVHEELGYLQAFQDTILAYNDENTEDLSNFLTWWEDKGQQVSVKMSEDLDAMRIVTIHKSKGLEYKAVIVPFCNWKLDHAAHHENILWRGTEQKPFNQIPTLPIKYGTDLIKTHYAEHYYLEQIKAYLDNLNILYVALTRAEEYIHLIGEKPAEKKGKKANTPELKAVNQLLYQIFDAPVLLNDRPQKEDTPCPKLNDYWRKEQAYIEIGEMETKAESKYEESSDFEALSLNKYMSHDWHDRLKITKKAENFFNLDNEDDRQEKINYGNLIHDVLSKIKRSKDIEYALTEIHQEALIDESELTFVRGELERIIFNEKVIDWFDGDWDIKTEVPILPNKHQLKSAKDEVRLDRVLIKDDLAVVIDFKTGFPKAKDVKQVKEYKMILGEMGFKRVEAYLLYIDHCEIQMV